MASKYCIRVNIPHPFTFMFLWAADSLVSSHRKTELLIKNVPSAQGGREAGSIACDFGLSCSYQLRNDILRIKPQTPEV